MVGLRSHDHFFVSHLEFRSKAARHLLDVLTTPGSSAGLTHLGWCSRADPSRHERDFADLTIVNPASAQVSAGSMLFGIGRALGWRWNKK
jgi:hypothetical protein